MLPRQKEQMVSASGDFEDIRALFKESCTKGAFDGRDFLTQQTLKQLMMSCGYTSVLDSEITTLFSEIDRDQNGKIELEEFLAFVYAADKFKV
jgi:Ca2+-binding EF-hand superfamily protein